MITLKVDLPIASLISQRKGRQWPSEWQKENEKMEKQNNELQFNSVSLQVYK